MVIQKKFLRKVVILVIALVVLIPCGFLLHDTVKSTGKEELECYYMMNDGKLKPLKRSIDIQSKDDLLAAAFSTLKEGPKSDGAAPTIPTDVELLSAKMDGETAKINLSGEYGHLQSVEEVICRSSIVWTLTSLDFVHDVELTVEGQPIYTKNGEQYGLMNRENILIDSVIAAEPTEYAVLKLYFANEQGSELMVEERIVEVSANQPREKTILEQLIAGPLEKGYYPTIPADTKIRDVTVTNDGTCYVNLSQDFITKHSGGSSKELLMVYSIVNSLCQLETVERVQFLIEGQKLDGFKGHIDFKKPFTAIDSLKTLEKSEDEASPSGIA